MYGICQQLILQVNLTTEECLEGDEDNDTDSDGVSAAQGQCHMGRIERKIMLYTCACKARVTEILHFGLLEGVGNLVSKQKDEQTKQLHDMMCCLL